MKAARRRRATTDAGQSPLEYMLRVMRDPAVDEKRRDDMAKAAAPYLHAKISTVEAKVEVDGAVEVSVVRLVGPA